MKFDCWRESDSTESDSSVFKMIPWSKEGPHSEFRTNNTMNRKKHMHRQIVYIQVCCSYEFGAGWCYNRAVIEYLEKNKQGKYLKY